MSGHTDMHFLTFIALSNETHFLIPSLRLFQRSIKQSIRDNRHDHTAK